MKLKWPGQSHYWYSIHYWVMVSCNIRHYWFRTTGNSKCYSTECLGLYLHWTGHTQQHYQWTVLVSDHRLTCHSVKLVWHGLPVSKTHQFGQGTGSCHAKNWRNRPRLSPIRHGLKERRRTEAYNSTKNRKWTQLHNEHVTVGCDKPVCHSNRVGDNIRSGRPSSSWRWLGHSKCRTAAELHSLKGIQSQLGARKWYIIICLLTGIAMVLYHGIGTIIYITHMYYTLVSWSSQSPTVFPNWMWVIYPQSSWQKILAHWGNCWTKWA